MNNEIPFVTPNVLAQEAPLKAFENIREKAPARKFRIVHHNESLQQHNSEVAKSDPPSNHGFSIFKPSYVPDINDEEPAHEEASPQIRRKEKGFLKAITNSIKEN